MRDFWYIHYSSKMLGYFGRIFPSLFLCLEEDILSSK